MATRDELYAKFGVTAEAAQLFETELGTLLLAVKALENEWHVTPNPAEARALLNQIESHTLGRMLGILRGKIKFDDSSVDQFVSALKARNRLNHGFYQQHDFKIQTEEGRKLMVADLEELHNELFRAWQVASAMSDAIWMLMKKLRASAPEL